MGMFDWFRSKPECPVDDASRSWVDARWRWLEGQFGVERVRKCAAVLPRPEFFPDSYDGTEDDARRVLDRVCGYMDVDPGCIEMSLYSDQGPLAGHPMFEGQWQGTTGLYHPEGDKFRVWLEAANLHDPLAMVATMAHELGHVHLLGHGRLSGDEEDQEPLTDLLTVYFGLGAITANSVIREQSWQEGPFSGWKPGRGNWISNSNGLRFGSTSSSEYCDRSITSPSMCCRKSRPTTGLISSCNSSRLRAASSSVRAT